MGYFSLQSKGRARAEQQQSKSIAMLERRLPVANGDISGPLPRCSRLPDCRPRKEDLKNGLLLKVSWRSFMLKYIDKCQPHELDPFSVPCLARDSGTPA